MKIFRSFERGGGGVGSARANEANVWKVSCSWSEWTIGSMPMLRCHWCQGWRVFSTLGRRAHATSALLPETMLRIIGGQIIRKFRPFCCVSGFFYHRTTIEVNEMIDHIFDHFGIRAISIPFRYKYEVACKYPERNINYLSIDQLFNSILTITTNLGK